MMKRRKGFTLIELMIVIAIIAIIAAIAIPQLLRSRIGANETSAIGTLKAISAGQEQFRTASCVDRNVNGVGEYGFMVELAGAQACRGSGINVATSPYIPSIFATDISTKSGYCYATYIVSGGVGVGTHVWVTVAANAAADITSDPGYNEENYLCFAWPTTVSRSGNRVFVISPQGTIMQNPNSGPVECTGALAANMPEFDSCLTAADYDNAALLVNSGPGNNQAHMAANWAPIG